MSAALLATSGDPVPASLPAFALHPAAWVGVLALGAAYATVIRRRGFAVAPRQAWSFIGGLWVLVGALTWPLADLANHALLLALVVQRLLLLLAVPPLLVAGLPRTLLAALTRPAPIDALARLFSRPVPAVIAVTVVAVATLSVPVVDAAASSAVIRGGADVLLVVTGDVLWAPVLRPVPGTAGMSVLGGAGYLVAQSILPGFLSFVWVFARHPLYSPFVHSGHVLGLGPLADQQVSGIAAKFATIAVLWTVALVRLLRADHDGGGTDDEPLTWVDVERQLERVARQERRSGAGRQQGR